MKDNNMDWVKQVMAAAEAAKEQNRRATLVQETAASSPMCVPGELGQ